MTMKQLDLFADASKPRRAEETPVDLPDEPERRRVREHLDANLFVEAAAGTGKTTELVRRIIAVLRSGRTTLGRMVALTFTDKAAGELKLRLREEIERERDELLQRPDVRVLGRMDRALGELEAAQIGTIHSFCAELLRERPVEAGVDPLFETAADQASEQLLDEAFDSWFQQVLGDPPEGVRRLLRRRQGRQGDGPRQVLRSAVASLIHHRDFPAPWRREAFDRTVAIDRLVEQLAQLGELAARASYPDDWLARSLEMIQRFVDELRVQEAASEVRDYDGLEERLRQLNRQRLWSYRGSQWRKELYPGLSRDETLARREKVKSELEHFLALADPDLAACLQRDLQPVIVAYEQLKVRSGKLDFLDLLVRARDLVRDSQALRAELQARYTHFLVDEFQDTDPLQAELLLLLSADDPRQSDWTQIRAVPGKLFLVGDPKQSIYRFRRADVEMYEAIKARLLAQGAELVNLRASFRSVPSIQQAVNAAFAPVMQGDPDHGQASYVSLEAVRQEAVDQPSVVALPVPRPYSAWRRPQITSRAIEGSFPDGVGAFVSWLVEHSGWTVEEPDEQGRRIRAPVEPRHVCLLFRRFWSYFGGDMTRPYVRALEARRISHVVVGGRSFHDREEVLALRNALCAIEWPDDELAVYATLHGPLFALPDDRLLAFRHHRGRLHPLRRFDLDDLRQSEREVAEALALLGGLYPGRNRRPIAATILHLLDGVRAHAGLATWPTGEQALANVLQLIDLARRFEASGATSFRSFVEWLEESAERGTAQEAPVVEEGTEGVRMMTVHKAKGLEFPVVILVDPTAPLSRWPSRHVDASCGLWAEPLAGCVPHDLLEHQEQELRRDQQEEVRLVYVAATRARDLLVVPVTGDQQLQNWLEVLNPAVYPPLDRQRRAEQAPGCPRFSGDETVVDRPSAAEAPPGSSVRPGQHQPRAGEHRVVWWAPGDLELDVEHQLGIKQQQLVEAADGGGLFGSKGQRAYELWRAQREYGLQRGAVPSVRVDAVTDLATELAAHPPELDEEAPVEVCEVEERGRDEAIQGKRFGTLVHAILAVIPLDGARDLVRAAAAVQGRMVGATEEEVEAATLAVLAALQHPVVRSAAASDQVRRESPVVLKLAEGHLTEGVVDLAFFDTGSKEWVVVDFKTDLSLEPKLPEYLSQLQLYMRAISRATGKPARGVLLAV